MERGHEPTGDYGYDLVHEEVAADPDRQHRDAGRSGGPAPARGRDEAGGDLSYDQAHDF